MEVSSVTSTDVFVANLSTNSSTSKYRQSSSNLNHSFLTMQLHASMCSLVKIHIMHIPRVSTTTMTQFQHPLHRTLSSYGTFIYEMRGGRGSALALCQGIRGQIKKLFVEKWEFKNYQNDSTYLKF